MKYLKTLVSVLLLFITFLGNSQSNKAYFTLKPTLTPDAKYIIFSFENDLWKVATEGG